MAKIECKNLVKVYDDKYALDGVNFSLDSGDFLVIMGESGGGKTTLLRCIAGLLSITAGELFIDGELCNLSPVQERKVGVVFQEYTLYPQMTVFENIAFALKKQKLPFDEECARVRKIIKDMGLSVIQSALPKQLSYGQKQKVAIARALVKNPDIVLFDEPLSNIDEPSRIYYRQLICEAKQLFPNSTFIYVTHNIDDALSIGNKLLVLNKGKVIQYDKLDNVIKFPCSKEIIDYTHIDIEEKHIKIENGKVLDDEIEQQLTAFQKSTLPQNISGEFKAYLFDSYTTIIGTDGAIIGLKKDLKFDVFVDENNLMRAAFGQFDVSAVANGLLKRGTAILSLDRQKISVDKTEDSIIISGRVIYSDGKYVTVDVSGERIGLDIPYASSDVVDLYYPISDIKLFDKEGNIMLSSYEIDSNCLSCNVIDNRKGIVRIGKEKLYLGITLPNKKNVSIQFGRRALEICSKDKRSNELIVLNEEQSKDYSIVYAKFAGMEGYLTLFFDTEFQAFSYHKIYVRINNKEIRVLD